MHYPSDPTTHPIQTQFLYGPFLRICPVSEGSSTFVSSYLPSSFWYDLFTHKPVSGADTSINHTDQSTSDILILVRSGSIILLRDKSAMTTKEPREEDFEVRVAPGEGGKAVGELYLDDGESLVQEGVSRVVF